MRWCRVGAWILLVGCGLLSACSSAVYHHVRSGETLFAIARRYGVSLQELVHLNDLPDPNRLEVGQRLRLPSYARSEGAATTAKRPSREKKAPERQTIARATSPSDSKEQFTPSPRDRTLRGRDGPFLWPVMGRVTSGYGPRNGSSHDGIDISAPSGTPIRAAADGEVLFSDTLRGYGRLVIIRHRNGYATVYAHNRVNLVREGQKVRRGQVIAEVGQSGRATGPHLHFEIRKDNIARNPLDHLWGDQQVVQK